MKNYDSNFYNEMELLSVTSAKDLIPILMDRYRPSSVADVGCGTGAFAHELISLGVEDVVGYEGDWMKNTQTILSKSKYVYCDLTRKIDASRVFDLCLCLEVAEHIDKSKARTLVDSLTALSSRIVFSAAIPKQGGNHHINEQWPEYWAKLFAEKGFLLDWDPRISIWDNHNIAACYRQNLLVFTRGTSQEIKYPISLVHPEIWGDALKYRRVPIWLKVLLKFPRSYLRMGKKVLTFFIKERQ